MSTVSSSPRATFPTGFLWGAATSAYQIEGSPLADGAGPSIWHRFAHTPGMIPSGDTGDVACDHYHRWREDIRLMRELGLTTYRFSISWSRILPDGVGRVNRHGLDFYSRMIDELLAAGIKPNATLYHWDLPAALDDRGGWLNPESAHWFADYADVLFRALDDRVPLWVTLNEPWVVADGGYLYGGLAPGHRSRWEAPRASIQLIAAHAEAVRAYRAVGKHQIGLVVNLEPKYAASPGAEDRAAVLRADAYMNRQYLDMALKGSFPEELVAAYGEAWPDTTAERRAALCEPIDFLGINYYTRGVMRHDPADWLLQATRVRQAEQIHSEIGWEVFPQGLTDVLLWVRDHYGAIPLYITENGAAFYDPPTPIDGRVEDPLRIAYLRAHLLAVHEAIRQGVDVRGYYVWSLLDNLEWAHGFSKRFGVVHVDFKTQTRTPKASARFYQGVIAANGV